MQPESWDDVGGPAPIDVVHQSLAIAQTQGAHEEIAALRAGLRQARQMADEGGQPPQTSIRLTGDTESAIFAALEKPISLALEPTPLAELTAVIQKAIGVQTVVDRRALEELGIGLDAPVSLVVDQMPAGQALRHLLHPLELGWTVADEVLTIAPEEDLAARPTVRVYPIHDLRDPRLDRGGLVPAWPMEPFDDIILAITSGVDADEWDGVGGPGSIAYVPGAQC